jgi:hypothetical protein
MRSGSERVIKTGGSENVGLGDHGGRVIDGLAVGATTGSLACSCEVHPASKRTVKQVADARANDLRARVITAF